MTHIIIFDSNIGASSGFITISGTKNEDKAMQDLSQITGIGDGHFVSDMDEEQVRRSVSEAISNIVRERQKEERRYGQAGL